MNKEFQDKIDKYLLDPEQMSSEERQQFQEEIEADPEKKEQLKFTRTVRQAITSREDKLKRMAEMKAALEAEREAAEAAGQQVAGDETSPCQSEIQPTGKGRSLRWMWLSGIAAAFLVGFFALRPAFVGEDSLTAPLENVRGSENDTFDTAEPIYDYEADTVQTVKPDSARLDVQSLP